MTDFVGGIETVLGLMTESKFPAVMAVVMEDEELAEPMESTALPFDDEDEAEMPAWLQTKKVGSPS
jgi:hypothetical protein